MEIDHSSCIYLIKNKESGKCYVGQTSDFHNRVNSHLSALRNNRSHNRHLQAAFLLYGEDAFEFSILEKCPVDELNYKEMYWIDKLDTYNNGYNLDMGGDGIRGYKYTDEQRKHISDALKGRVFSDETKRKMSENHADISGEKNPHWGIPLKDRMSKDAYEAYCRNCSDRYRGEGNPNYGKHLSDEQKEKMIKTRREHYKLYGNPRKGVKRPEISGDKSCNAHKVVCVNTGESFNTIDEAALKYHVSQSYISTVCSKKKGTAGVLPNGDRIIWRYFEDYTPMSQEEISEYILSISENRIKAKSKKVRCITTGEVFDSMKDACGKYHIDPSMLSAHCKGRRHKNGCGHDLETGEILKWEYIC